MQTSTLLQSDALKKICKLVLSPRYQFISLLRGKRTAYIYIFIQTTLNSFRFVRLGLKHRSVVFSWIASRRAEAQQRRAGQTVVLQAPLGHIYIYIYAFSFYPKRLTVHSGYAFIVSMCVPWESNPQPFALLTQCFTTVPQEHWTHMRSNDYSTTKIFVDNFLFSILSTNRCSPTGSRRVPLHRNSTYP